MPLFRPALAAACSAVILAAGVTSAEAATFTVTSANLTVDVNGCTAAHCSLPEAINAANLTGDADTIVFDGVTSITVPSPSSLPSIDRPVTIVGAGGGGTSCSGTPQVTLLGNSGAIGLQLDDGADGSTICRMKIGDFNTGIQVGQGADGVTIRRNYVGTDGTTALPQTFGISSYAATSITSNVVSGNTGQGISIVEGAASVTTNLVGTNITGTSALPNGQGVFIASATAVIGSTNPALTNVISGNTGNGVVADAGTIIGNRIGTNVLGTAAIPNGAGINAGTTSTARIGGPLPGEGNVISGNTGPGIRVFNGDVVVKSNLIGTDKDGNAALPNEDGIVVREGSEGLVVGGPGDDDGNIISGNTRYGIDVAPSGVAVGATTISGNVIGADDDGAAALPNSRGINISPTATGTTIGGTAAGAGNRIAGNANEGIYVNGDGTQIQQNTIGLASSGAALPNNRGIRTDSLSSGTVIGGPTAAARNVIAGNTSFGVLLGQGSGSATLQGNHIGLAADGTTVRANALGVRIDNATDAHLGGTTAGAGNVISGNSQYGVAIIGAVSAAPILEGNRIGTDATGLVARGNQQGGVLLAHSQNARIMGNVLSGNVQHGLDIQTGADGAQIHGNLIGVGADGATAIGNGRSGVFVQHQSLAVTVGGTAAGQGNTIRNNADDGITVGPAASDVLKAALLGNSIRDNGELGIDLAGDEITANDPGDVDTGDNDLQNFPELSGASTDGTQTTVTGTIDTTPGRTIRIEVFSNAGCDASGHGEADTFLDATQVTAGSGATPFSVTAGAVDPARRLTATATDLTTGQTSELSTCQPVAFLPPPSPIVSGPASPLLPSADPAPASAPPSASAAATPPKPAKLKVRRAGIDDGVLDLLVEITSDAATSGATLAVDYESSGRHTRFTVPITTAKRASGGEALLSIRKRLPSSQPKDTGIVELAFAGNAAVAPDEVRLRAADVQALLTRTSSSLSGGRLKAAGTVSSKARGVVRLLWQYTDGSGAAKLTTLKATIAGGRWSVDTTLTGDAAKGGYLSIQFTGYETAGMRGEQTGKQLP